MTRLHAKHPPVKQVHVSSKNGFLLWSINDEERFLPAMPNVVNNYHIAFNREQHSIGMGLTAIDQLPHFERNDGTFGSQRAAAGKIRKRRYRIC